MKFSKLGCPADLFNAYIEVGEIKLSSIQTDACRFIELWVGSCHKRNYVRGELTTVKRRPIIDVLDDILELAEDKRCCVLIMEDDGYEAVHSWYQATYLVVKYLKQADNVKAVVPFTKYTKDEVDELNKRDNIYDFFSDTRETFYDITDAYICGQSNIYKPAPGRKIFINNEKCSVIVRYIVEFVL